MSTQKKIRKWKQKCCKEHEIYAALLCDRIWDPFTLPRDDKHLYWKIAIGLFGHPKEAGNSLGFSKQQIALVEDIKQKCIQCSLQNNVVYLSVIFVHVYKDGDSQASVPVVRVRNNDSEEIEDINKNNYIDHLGNIYDSWEHYLFKKTQNNTVIGGPKDGYYDLGQHEGFFYQTTKGELKLSILQKPGLTTEIDVKHLKDRADPSVSYAPFGSTSSPTVDDQQCPPPVSIPTIEEKKDWLKMAGELASSGPIPILAPLLVKRLMGHRRVSIIADKIYHDENVTDLDIFRLMTSTFFFTLGICSVDVINNVIDKLQKMHIYSLRCMVPPADQPTHDVLLKASKENIVKRAEMKREGNAKFIKEMSRIDPTEMYSQLDLLEDGQLHINSEVTMHPRAYVQMKEEERKHLLELSKQLKEKTITLEEFNEKGKLFTKWYKIRPDQARLEGEEFLRKVYEVDDLKKLKFGEFDLSSLEPHDLDRLEQVVKHSFHIAGNEKITMARGRDFREVIKVVNRMAEVHGVKNTRQYTAAGEYIVRYIEEQMKKRRKMNSKPHKPNGMTLQSFYQTEIVRKLLEDDNFNDLKNARNLSFTEECDKCNLADCGTIRFEDRMAAANHYDHHGANMVRSNPNQNLMREEYFNIATEMVKGPIPADAKWTQNGRRLTLTFLSDDKKAIRYDNLENGTSVIATLMKADVELELRMYNVLRAQE